MVCFFLPSLPYCNFFIYLFASHFAFQVAVLEWLSLCCCYFCFHFSPASSTWCTRIIFILWSISVLPGFSCCVCAIFVLLPASLLGLHLGFVICVSSFLGMCMLRSVFRRGSFFLVGWVFTVDWEFCEGLAFVMDCRLSLLCQHFKRFITRSCSDVSD